MNLEKKNKTNVSLVVSLSHPQNKFFLRVKRKILFDKMIENSFKLAVVIIYFVQWNLKLNKIQRTLLGLA